MGDRAKVVRLTAQEAQAQQQVIENGYAAATEFAATAESEQAAFEVVIRERYDATGQSPFWWEGWMEGLHDGYFRPFAITTR